MANIKKGARAYYADTDYRRDGMNEAYSKIDSMPAIPTPEVSDVGKVIKVNNEGEYGLAIDESLPVVTSSDEGKVLTVDSNGNWVAANFSGGNAEVAMKNYFRVNGYDAYVNLTNLILASTHKVKVIFNTTGAGSDNAVIFCTNRGGWDARNSLNVRFHQGKYIVGATATDIAYSAGDHTVEFNLANGEMKFDDNTITDTFNTQWTIGNCIRIGKMDSLGSNAAAYIKSVQITDQNNELLFNCEPAVVIIGNSNNAFYMYDSINDVLYGSSDYSEAIDSI